MKTETNVLVEEYWVSLHLTWLNSALQGPLAEDKKAEFLANAKTAFMAEAQKLANEAFQLGVDFGKRNPNS